MPLSNNHETVSVPDKVEGLLIPVRYIQASMRYVFRLPTVVCLSVLTCRQQTRGRQRGKNKNADQRAGGAGQHSVHSVTNSCFSRGSSFGVISMAGLSQRNRIQLIVLLTHPSSEVQPPAGPRSARLKGASVHHAPAMKWCMVAERRSCGS